MECHFQAHSVASAVLLAWTQEDCSLDYPPLWLCQESISKMSVPLSVNSPSSDLYTWEVPLPRSVSEDFAWQKIVLRDVQTSSDMKDNVITYLV